MALLIIQLYVFPTVLAELNLQSIHICMEFRATIPSWYDGLIDQFHIAILLLMSFTVIHSNGPKSSGLQQYAILQTNDQNYTRIDCYGYRLGSSCAGSQCADNHCNCSLFDFCYCYYLICRSSYVGCALIIYNIEFWMRRRDYNNYMPPN